MGLTQSVVTCLLMFAFCSCRKPISIPDYSNVDGYVMGKEVCKANEADNYWLIDLTYNYNTPQYGDTLILNGRTYTNVIKTKTLRPPLNKVGMPVSIDFKVITSDKVQTTGCSVSNPITYNLKEFFVINQFEIR